MTASTPRMPASTPPAVVPRPIKPPTVAAVELETDRPSEESEESEKLFVDDLPTVSYQMRKRAEGIAGM